MKTLTNFTFIIKGDVFMKAAVIYGTKDVRIENIAEPSVTAGHIKVKVEWAGICGSDLHAYHHGIGIFTEPHPVTKRLLPLVQLAVGDSQVIEDLGCSLAVFTGFGHVASVGESLSRIRKATCSEMSNAQSVQFYRVSHRIQPLGWGAFRSQ